MRKKSLMIAALCTLGLAQAAWAQPIRAELDGRPLQFEQPPIMIGGQVMVPLRGIFESLGADVRFEGATQTIRATRGNRLVQLRLGSSEASVDGQPVHLSAPARTVGGSTMVPLRFVSEALGADVRWISATHTVVLSSPDGSTAGPVSQPPVYQPPLAPAAAPIISSVIHNARGPLQPGDRLVVSLNGDPGGEASFEILGLGYPVPMREVSAGSYEGEVVISRDMHVSRGTLVARLRKNGREAAMEAPRPVTLAARQEGPPRPVAAAGFDVRPPQGAVLDNPRQPLEVHINPPFVPTSTRLLLDGADVTSYSAWRGNEMIFQPRSDLAPGNHVAQVVAYDQAGRQQTQDWAFSVRGAAFAPPPTRGYSNQLTITNLGNGAAVPPVFNVQGQAAPYATIRANVDTSRALIPGVLRTQGRLSAETVADPTGHFDMQLDASSVPRGTTLTLQIQATDREGRGGPMRMVDVVVR